MVTNYTTAEEAKAAILATLELPNWEEILCTDYKGEYSDYFNWDRGQEFALSLSFLPAHFFFNREMYEKQFREFIIQHLDYISEWVVTGRIMRTITERYSQPVGYSIYEDNGKPVVIGAYELKLCLRHKRYCSTPGFYISDFGVWEPTPFPSDEEENPEDKNN